MKYEALWFCDHDNIKEDCFSVEFKTKNECMKYYQEHKDDSDKYGWLVTKRDKYWQPVEIYIGEVDYSR